MDPPAPHASAVPKPAMTALLALFLASGATSLTYQILWVRQLHLVLGTSTFAIATVLAAFMGGLGLGGLAMARWADRIRRPLVVYGGLELGIGAYALAFPGLLELAQPVHVAWGAAPVVASVMLLLPTSAMGATLPLLARYATDSVDTAGDRLGRLYAVNTAGAVLGTAAAAFLLLPALGLWLTTCVAAAGNGAIGLGAWGLDRAGRPPEPVPSGPDEAAPSGLLMAVMAAAGFAGLVYEVAWTRVLALVLGPTVTVFAVMLVAFLFGIALGGRIGGPVADRIRRRWGAQGVLVTLAAVEVGVGATSWALAHAYPELPFAYVWLFDQTGVADRPEWASAISLAIAALVMTPPAVLMGAAWPLAVRAEVVRPDALGRGVGRITGANTLGGALGAAVAGFVLLPHLQVTGTLALAVWVNVAAALGLVAVAGVRAGRIPPGAALVAGAGLLVALFATRVPWQPKVMTTGLYHYVSHFSDHSRDGIDRFGISSYDLRYYREGRTSVVTVGADHATGALWLANNGKVEATNQWDMPTQVLCGLLPLQYVDRADDVLLIGLASGITAGAIASDPRVARLEVVEIEAATVGAARLFEAWNGAVVDDPRVSIHINDGRNHVLRAPAGRYDVIVSEPSNPWITGVSNLFTQEFYALGKTRLRPGGVWAQWLHAYGMDPEELRRLLATFAAEFPHVAVIDAMNLSDLVLIGSDQPLEAEPGRLLDVDVVADKLRDVGVSSPVDLMARYLMDGAAVRKLTRGVDLNTDDNMRVEYAAPRSVHRNTSSDNAALLLGNAQLPPDVGPEELRALIGRYTDAGDERRAAMARLRLERSAAEASGSTR